MCLVRKRVTESMHDHWRLSTGCLTLQPPAGPGCSPSAPVHASVSDRARAQARTPRPPAGVRGSAARAAAPSAAAFRRQRAALAATTFTECASRRRAPHFAAHRACCLDRACTARRPSVWRQHAAPAANAISERASWHGACLAIAHPHAPVSFSDEQGQAASSAASADMLRGSNSACSQQCPFSAARSTSAAEEGCGAGRAGSTRACSAGSCPATWPSAGTRTC